MDYQEHLGLVLTPTGMCEEVDSARRTFCGTTKLEMPHIHNGMGIIVELKPWPSWKISGHDNVVSFWWFLQNAFSAIFSAAIANLMDWWSAIPFVQPAHTISDATAFGVFWW